MDNRRVCQNDAVCTRSSSELVSPRRWRREDASDRPRAGLSTSAWRLCKRANDIRVKRAQLKKDLKCGRGHGSTRSSTTRPEYVATAKVFDMLMAVPKFGRVKAARFLNQCRISQSKTVGGLSDRQRH